MSIQLRGLHRDLRPYAEWTLAIAHEFGLNPTITSVFRDWQEQARLRERWEQGKSRWPANQPGDSAHNWGLAWDSWVPEDQMETWRAIREWVGWRVPPNDAIHAEVPGWRSLVTG